MLFREHRGSLTEAMKTLVKLEDRETLIKHCQVLLKPYNIHFDQTSLNVSPYYMQLDIRTGWKQTYIVTILGYGVIGFTDSAY